MAQKGRKVYRSKSRRRSSGRVGKKIIFVLFILCIIALAYVATGWILSMINAPDTGETTSSQTSSALEDGTVSGGEEEGAVAPAAQPGYTALSMPQNILLDPTQWQGFLDSAKAQGYTAVTVTLKDGQGALYYNSGVTRAVNNGAVVTGAVNAAQLCQTIEATGLTPIARMGCFVDRYGSIGSDATLLPAAPAVAGNPQCGKRLCLSGSLYRRGSDLPGADRPGDRYRRLPYHSAGRCSLPHRECVHLCRHQPAQYHRRYSGCHPDSVCSGSAKRRASLNAAAMPVGDALSYLGINASQYGGTFAGLSANVAFTMDFASLTGANAVAGYETLDSAGVLTQLAGQVQAAGGNVTLIVSAADYAAQQALLNGLNLSGIIVL